MTYVYHDIVIMSAFHYLIPHRGYHEGFRMRSSKCLPFWTT